MPRKILIADGHDIVRLGLKYILQAQNSTENMDEASSEEELHELVKAKTYDIIFLGTNLPGTDVTLMLDWLRRFVPQTGIIVCPTYIYEDKEYEQRSYALGAKAYLHRTSSSLEIIQAFKTVANGGTYSSDRN